MMALLPIKMASGLLHGYSCFPAAPPRLRTLPLLHYTPRAVPGLPRICTTWCEPVYNLISLHVLGVPILRLDSVFNVCGS